MSTIINGTTNAITFPDGTIQTTAASGFASGTVLLFYQAAAPTGWTQVTTQDNKALRVVSGSGGVAGGTTAFSTVFANQTVTTSVSISGTTGATTLSTAQIPSHTHSYTAPTPGAGLYTNFCGGSPTGTNGATTGAEGSGGSHTHSFSGSGSGTSSAVTLNVQYIDIILASKN